MAPITRFAAFKYLPGTTDMQKRQSLDGLINLYNANADMVNVKPRGGRNNNTEGFDGGFDVVFTVEFKSKVTRDQFILNEEHVKYKNSIMGIVAEVIVYDFEEGDYGY
ncbi:hypothetical protein BJ138DRAFT_1135865 [Hygrophoropsis aurantiaca]|uniref:Uncharacterized protein n=1 Tax=Hygrophoropsis aurantiaca TaxID=72124 RepID=A0ACB8AC12_9AGAM|nr:hypothetical protein BJ138DRAFT_1135865 [Hygrophoropsis aurantiaca]